MIRTMGRSLARLAATTRERLQGLSGVGVALGTLFFAASLTPTLVPRSFFTQGVLAGACLAIGYGAGVLTRWLWRYLELPRLPAPILQRGTRAAVVLCTLLAVLVLWQAAGWQNSVRAAMEMPPVASAHPFKLSAIAVLTFAVLLLTARLFGYAAHRLARLMRRFIPRRVANVLGVLAAALLFWSMASDLLFRSVFRALDASYREYDALLEPERPQPPEPGKTGSPASLLDWGELGRAGREFVASGPDARQISAFSGREALEPIRVYVGLRSAEEATERAELALRELQRQGGFDRRNLVIITPTGTGWVDPAAMDALEYLHHGDVASVAVQYSYLSSPLSLLVQPELGAETSRALFARIYDYWTGLPRDSRPRLYLHGLSLGAMNSEASTDLLQLLDDPIDGALWSGPPFPSRIWRSLIQDREPDTPIWLPRYRDGRFVRFMNQSGSPVPGDSPWGRIRIVYLQYASDPIVFFDYRDAWRRPAWMQAPLGPDVSPALRWYPVVTMLQLALDMAVANTTPMGHGHVYAPAHYLEGWLAVTDVRDWAPARLQALRDHLTRRAVEAAVQARGG